MASFVSENVYDEKVDAIRKFDRRKNLWRFLPAIEVIVVVLLLVSWLKPSLFTGEHLWPTVSGGFTSGIIAFGVVNVLVALIFSLSNHQNLTKPDLYFQYVSSSAVAPVDGFSSFSSSVVSKALASENEEKTSEEKLKTDFNSVVTPTDNALSTGEARPMKKEMVRAVSSVAETANTIKRKSEMTFLPPCSTENATDHQVYRRSSSERLDMRGDLRRNMRRLCEIDDLSNDEFRSKVELFIAGKKKMLLSKDWMKLHVRY